MYCAGSVSCAGQAAEEKQSLHVCYCRQVATAA